MKNYISIFCLTVSMALSGCSDWLDVKQIDKNLEKDQFATTENIYNVLNGFYLNMASEKLYGGQLTMTVIEHLARYYYSPEDIFGHENFQTYFDLQTYDYESTKVEPRFSKIWEEMYSIILQINKFIVNLEKDEVLTETNRKIVLGEAYALRAYLHFDLFRLFGPIPSEGMEGETIPYNTSSLMQIHPYLSGNEFLDKIMEDIASSKSYLANDPILERGVIRFESLTDMTSTEKFNLCLRNRRMNILAVGALEARVQQYFGKTDNAASLAQEVITKLDGIITWTKTSDFSDYSNHIFYTEILFAIENPNLYSSWASYTTNSDPSKTYAAITSHIVKNIFASQDDDLNRTTDLRSKQWVVNTDLGNAYYVSKKFNNHSFSSLGTNKEQELSNLIHYAQPLMRMSELHYIIAEANLKNGVLPDVIKSFNNISYYRGKTQSEELQSTATLQELEDFLEREYYREFYGEGQVFFFLKRNMKTSLFRTTGAIERSFRMDLKKYIVPIPLNERNF